jgi:hypothetical protein
MKIEQSEDSLIIRETPGCLWFVGLFFALVGGIFVYGALGGFTDYDKQAPWVIAFAGLMGSCAVGVGIWAIYKAPVTKVVISNTENKVFLSRFGLFEKQKSVYAFEEISRFCLVEERDDEGDPIWSVGFILTSGETIKLNSLPSHSEEYERKYVFQVNKFMRKQMSPLQMILETDDENH